MSIAKLQLVLDSTQMRAGAEATTRELNKVTASSKAAEAAVRAQARVMSEAATVAQRQAQAQKAAADAAAAHARAQREAARSVAEATRANQQLTGIMGQLKAAVAAYLSLNTARALAEMADQATLLEARLRLVTASAGEAAGVQYRLAQLARENGVAYGDLSQIYTRLARGAGELGITQRTVMQTTEALSLAVRVSGATAQEASAALLQFSQGIASGRLGGEELRAVLEQLPRVAQAVAAGLGVTTGKLRELGAAGKLGPAEVLGALTTQLEALRREAAQLPATIGQGVERLGNGALKLVDALSRSTQLGAALAGMFTTIAEKAEQAANALDRTTDTSAGFRQAAAEARNLSWRELNTRLGTARQAYLERRAELGPSAFQNDRRRDQLSELLDPVRALEAERRRRMSQRAGTLDRIIVTVPELTDAERRKAEREAAEAREGQFAFDQHRFHEGREATRRLLALRQSLGFDLPFEPETYEGQGRRVGTFLDKHPARDADQQAFLERVKREQEAAEQVRENLTRGLQSAAAAFGEGLLTDGLRSARSFVQQFGGLLRRAVAEAFAASVTQRFITPFVNKLTGGMEAVIGAGTGGSKTSPGTTSAVAVQGGGGMAAGAAAFGVVAAAGLLIGAFQGAAAATQRYKDAQEAAARSEASIRSRYLRATGRAGEAEALDSAERNRQEIAELNRQREEQLAATRRRMFTGAQVRKREGEIHSRFDQLIADLLKTQEAERSAALGGSIGDYNVTAGLNVAAMIGDIRRATLAAPDVPTGATGGGGGRDGLTIVIQGDVTTQAKSAGEFVRELQAMAQNQYGSQAEWSRVAVMA